MKYLALLLAPLLFAQEADLEKRYMQAFDAANKAIDASRAASNEGKLDESKKLLDECASSVESVLTSLEAMGKPPHKNGKHYKRAELKSRDILRRMDALLRDSGLDERETLAAARERVNVVHEKLLEGVMSKKS